MAVTGVPRYVAGGFLQDADKLLSDFQILETLEFVEFANLWRQAYFSLIYMGREQEREMCEFTGECFMITLGLMQRATDKYRKAGALYLLYSLYYKQPLETKYSIRILLSQWNEIIALFNLGVKENCLSLSYAVNRLVKERVFHFVVFPRMMGPRSTLTTEPWEAPNRPSESKNSYLINFLEEKPFSVMNDLHAEYEKVKSYLTDNDKNELRVLDKCENDQFAVALEAIAFNRKIDLKQLLAPAAEDEEEANGEVCVKEGENIGNRRTRIKQKQFSTSSSGHISKRRSQLLHESHSEAEVTEGEEKYYLYNGLIKKKHPRKKGRKRGRGRPPKGYVKKRGRPKKNAEEEEEEEEDELMVKPEPEEDENFVPEINVIDGVPVPSYNGRKVELKRRPPRGKKTKYHFASDSDEELFVLSDEVVEDEVEELLRERDEEMFVKQEVSEEDEEAAKVVNGNTGDEEEQILSGELEEMEIVVNGTWHEDADNEVLTF